MSSAPSRRALVAGLALSTAPVAALALQGVASADALAGSPDAELITLVARWQAAYRVSVAANNRVADLDDAYELPERPAELREKGNDYFDLKVGTGTVRDGRFRYFDEEQVAEMRREPRTYADMRGGRLDAEGRLIDVPRRPDPRAQARAEEIVMAWDAWVAECDATRTACGLTTAEEEADAAEDAEWELRQAALATPARTIEGLRAKAEVIALATDEMSTLARLAERGDRMAGTIIALVRDLLAMEASA